MTLAVVTLSGHGRPAEIASTGASPALNNLSPSRDPPRIVDSVGAQDHDGPSSTRSVGLWPDEEPRCERKKDHQDRERDPPEDPPSGSHDEKISQRSSSQAAASTTAFLALVLRPIHSYGTRRIDRQAACPGSPSPWRHQVRPHCAQSESRPPGRIDQAMKDCLMTTTMRHSGSGKGGKRNTSKTLARLPTSTSRGIGFGDRRVFDVDQPQHLDKPQDFDRSQESPRPGCNRSYTSNGYDSGRYYRPHHWYRFHRSHQGRFRDRARHQLHGRLRHRDHRGVTGPSSQYSEHPRHDGRRDK